MNATVRLCTGTRLVHDGTVLTVVGIDAERLRLRDASGRVSLIHTATLMGSAATRIIGEEPPAAAAVAPLLDSLDVDAAAETRQRLAHVRELLTGYRSGDPALPEPGEPRPAYHPWLPMKKRQDAKAAELGVTGRTLRRWVASLRERGPGGVIDGRHLRTSNRLAGVDERWLAMCRIVLDEHVDASRPTKDILLDRIGARLTAEYGEGTVPQPGRRRARSVLAELTKGTNAFTGSTSGKRSIAARPKGVYGRLRPTRPGEYVLLDTTPLDVFAMEPLTLRWVRLELTVALDLYSRCILGLRLSPVSTKSVDAALVLFETLVPNTRRLTSSGLLPYAGVPDLLITRAEAHGGDGVPAGLPGAAPESIVVDHGKIYLSGHMLTVCNQLGISVQPARPLTPTDKAAVERFFRTLREQLLVALPGYKGPDVYSRGKDPEGCTYYFIDEMESVLREWISTIYHHRAHGGLVDPAVPGLDLSPCEMFAHGMVRAGHLRVLARADLVFDLLPIAWRTIQHYGVEINGLRYNAAALDPYRNRRSPHTGIHAGKWPLRFDTDDVSRVFFQDPVDHRWHTLVWEHASDIGVPFSAETLTYARRLALADNRHVNDRHALAELLERWDAGLIRHPAERRMAIRASEQRQARIAAGDSACTTAEVCALSSVRAVTDPAPHGARTQPSGAGADRPMTGDDDLDVELDLVSDDEDGELTDEQFYADALGMLR
jgi:transposase InsO family protein